MEDLLRSKGLYRITLGIETAPDDDEKEAKWENKNDQARGLIGMSISPELRFHLDGEDSPIKAWAKLNTFSILSLCIHLPFYQRSSP